MKRATYVLLASLIALIALGALVGLGLRGKLDSVIERFFANNTAIYQDSHRLTTVQQFQPLSWDALLPDAEKALLGQTQSTQNPQQNLPLHEQVFQSIQRTFDDEYQQALISVNTVDTFNGKYVETHRVYCACRGQCTARNNGVLHCALFRRVYSLPTPATESNCVCFVE